MIFTNVIIIIYYIIFVFIIKCRKTCYKYYRILFKSKSNDSVFDNCLLMLMHNFRFNLPISHCAVLTASRSVRWSVRKSLRWISLHVFSSMRNQKNSKYLEYCKLTYLNFKGFPSILYCILSFFSPRRLGTIRRSNIEFWFWISPIMSV